MKKIGLIWNSKKFVDTTIAEGVHARDYWSKSLFPESTTILNFLE